MADAAAWRRFRPGGQVLFFAALSLVTGAATWLLKGRAAFLDAIAGSAELVLAILPVLLGAMLLAGYAQSLLPRERVARWLGRESGFRGIVVATLAGAATPGGPFASFALVVALAKSGADIGACIAYLTAWSVLGLHRLLLWELPLLGEDLGLLRYAVSLPLPLLAGVAARLAARRVRPWTLPQDP